MRPERSIRSGLTRCKSDRRREGEFMRYRLSAAIALVMVGLLVVVGVSSPASAATPTESYKGGKCGYISVAWPNRASEVSATGYAGTDRYGCVPPEPSTGPATSSSKFMYQSTESGTSNTDLYVSKPLPVGSAPPSGPYVSSSWDKYQIVPVTGSPQVFAVFTSTRVGEQMTAVVEGRIKIPAAGTLAVDPSVTCDGFKSASYAVALGTLDLSWRWAGAVPSRGWRITDAALGAAAGSGNQLSLVSVTPLASTSRYGVTDWPVPPDVASIRVESRNDSACYMGFSLTRNESGAVTGVYPAGATPDLTPDPVAEDANGNSCSMIDLPCHLQYLFIPDPSSWGWDELRTSMLARPPLSMVTAVWSGLGELSSAFTSSNCRGVEFGLEGGGQNWDAGEFKCAAGTAAHGGPLYEIARYCLLAVTAVYLYRTLMSGFRP